MLAMMFQIPIADDENKVGKIVAVATVEISKRIKLLQSQ